MGSPLSESDLKYSALSYLDQWAYLTVSREVMVPYDTVGQKFISIWDNWTLPPDPFGLDPLVEFNSIAQTPTTNYTIPQYGDSVRGIIQMANPVGVRSVILVSYRRALYRDAMWSGIINQSYVTVMGLLLKTPKSVTAGLSLDDVNDPWHIVVMQTAKAALINLQTFLAGLGRHSIESVVVDMSRAHSAVHEVIDDLSNDIRKAIYAWRWAHSPKARLARPTLGGYPQGVFFNPWWVC